MTSGFSMHVMIRTAPPQAAQASMSMPKTRFRRCAQGIVAYPCVRYCPVDSDEGALVPDAQHSLRRV